ncbi:hypothetical protein KM043_013507 [Ampulex compressa]|nr:hypothetical protein KM043_013507 [Ampulex compressa]
MHEGAAMKKGGASGEECRAETTGIHDLVRHPDLELPPAPPPPSRQEAPADASAHVRDDPVETRSRRVSSPVFEVGISEKAANGARLDRPGLSSVREEVLAEGPRSVSRYHREVRSGSDHALEANDEIDFVIDPGATGIDEPVASSSLSLALEGGSL